MQKNNSRIFISYFLLAFVALIIVFRVIYIQKSDEKFSSSNAPKFFEIEALRGNIIAENVLMGGAVFQSTGDVIAGGNI